MQFTNEVKWGTIDFIIAAVLLISTGIIISYIQEKITNKKYRILITVGIISLLLYAWLELAVGIFGNTFSGN